MAETTERQRMALSKPESIRRDISNCACIARIISGPCTNILRNVLANKISLPDLKRKFSSLIRYYQIDKDAFFKLERLIAESNENYSDFEIPSMYFFLRWICDIPQHGNRWGQYPREKDRSLSANIERIYLIRAKYRRLRHGSLSDSTIENEWENIFTTVKELEKFIGFGKENQDAMIKIKNASLDPDVEDILIKHLLGYDHDDEFFKILEYEMELHLRLKPIEVKALSLGPIREHYKDPSMSMREQRGLDLRSEIQTSLDPSLERLQSSDYGSVEEFHDDISESTGEEKSLSLGPIREHYKDPSMSMREQRDPSWERLQSSGYPSVEEFHDDISESTGEEKYILPKYEQITSETLKELFACYNVEFPTDVPGSESIARKILENDIKQFVHAIRSFSKRIVLSSSKKAITPSIPQVEVCVFEVEVVYDDGGDGKEETQFCVFRKDTSLSMLCDMEEDTRTRVILIRSESIPVVSSKLFVYKNFKHAINEKRIFLQHEYDDFDDLAKLIAYRLFSSFCSSVESIVNAFTMDLQKIMLDNCDRQMTVEEIEQTCLDVFKKTAEHRIWPIQAVNMIKSKLSKEELLGEEAWSEIQKACQQTVKDLKVILSRLEEFQTTNFQVDQRKEIEEWHRIEVVPDRSKLENYPFIIKYIAGRKYGNDFVKVFVSQDAGIKTQKCVNDCFKVSKDTEFEFENVKEMKKSKKDDAMKIVEEKDSASSQSTSGELFKIIRENRKKIFARYSNVIAIREGTKQGKPCVVLHCLDKDIVPYGENPLPECIGVWPCAVREDFITLANCPETCPSTNQNFPEPGCSIGISNHICSGSVGFLYESENYGSGFLTASHVAVKNCHRWYRKDKILSEQTLNTNIVHPSWPDTERRNDEHVVGKVVKAFFGIHKSSKGLIEGLDLAAVKTSADRRRGNPLQVTSYDKDMLEKLNTVPVKKTGKATGTTYGNLTDIACLQMEFPQKSKIKHDLPNVYVVENKTTASKFMDYGDSGSGVFVEGDPDKPLGIGIAISEKFPEAYVCNIEDFINKFDLKLEGYCEGSQNTTLPHTEKG